MLTLEHLVAGYGESTVLHGVDMTVPESRVICLMGRNGVGKTTLMKTVMGLIEPVAGQIRLADEEIGRWPPHRRARAGIGYVPQGREIFPLLTVEENLLMGFEASGKERPAKIDEMTALFPVLKNLLARKAGTLSGGQQQQLAIARALIGEPRVLLLDEPTEGIQPSIVDRIAEVIGSVSRREGLAVLIVEQAVDFALELADYVYVMDGGKIQAQALAGKLDVKSIKRYLTI